MQTDFNSALTPQATMTVAFLSVYSFYNSLLFIRIRIYKPDTLARERRITISELRPFWEGGAWGRVLCLCSRRGCMLFLVRPYHHHSTVFSADADGAPGWKKQRVLSQTSYHFCPALVPPSCVILGKSLPSLGHHLAKNKIRRLFDIILSYQTFSMKCWHSTRCSV